MPSDFPPSAFPETDIPAPGLIELFLAFAKMSPAGAPGVLVWRGIVDQHRGITVAALITVAAAALAFATKLDPFWMLAAGGILGFAGVVWRKWLGKDRDRSTALQIERPEAFDGEECDE